MSEKARTAAIHLSAQVGQVDQNLELCEGLAAEAARQGAQWIILPEFFTTGMAFDPALAECALPPDGAAAKLLESIATTHGVHAGGSFICADPDGEVRNAFMLFGPDGAPLGRHDKDLPTMWENCFYTGGADDGVLTAAGDGPDVGVAMCWELIRSQTARRLAGRVDLVVGGSCWWSVPDWPPKSLTQRWERENAANATGAAGVFARLVGAPVVHAAHCGAIDCAMPLTPIRYRGRAEGGAAVFGADGKALAFRAASEGPGVAIADVELGRVAPADAIPEDYWLCQRGPIPSLAWAYQNPHGRRHYRRRLRAS